MGVRRARHVLGKKLLIGSNLYPTNLAVPIGNIVGDGIPLYGLLITVCIGIAGIKNEWQRGLPFLVACISGSSHGQDNKSDTYVGAQLGLWILSRTSRFVCGKLKSLVGSPYNEGSQETTPYSNTRDNNYAQRPKTTLMTNTSQPRDLTAYAPTHPGVPRRRSFHSSHRHQAKGNSQKTSIPNSQISSTKRAPKTPTRKGGKSTVSASMWAKVELNKYLRNDSRYNGIIRIIANPLFLWACYEEIRGKPGNMSPGTTSQTQDGLRWAWFENLAQKILQGKFKFSPSRRVMIPKPGKTEKRPLSVGNPRDKIVQKAISVVLEAIWESEFLDSSYGFRPNKSLHQSLYQLHHKGATFQWVIQGDISKCFDEIPHNKILQLVGEKIVCQKTISLLKNSLTAGYLDPENGLLVVPQKGTPQGSVLSPLLANITLHELDQYMAKLENTFSPLPAAWQLLSCRQGKGKTRAKNPEYNSLTSQIQKLEKSDPKSPEARVLRIRRRAIPSVLPTDPNFKRLMYLRYADDFVVLITGSNDDANLIKGRIKSALIKKCGLILNEEKTIITRTRDGFHFLGAQCINPNSVKDQYCTKMNSGRVGRYRLRMRILAPIADLIDKLTTNRFVLRDNQDMPVATARKDLVNYTHHEIITFYNHRIRGILNFYSFAGNRNDLRKIILLLQLSCALTLALKYKLKTKAKVFKKFGRLLFLKKPAKRRVF